jgi:6-phosphogluconolactonase
MRIVLTSMIVLAMSQATLAQDDAAQPSAKFRAYIGTYTGPKSKGIYLMEFDAGSGALTLKGVAAETPSPSFLAIHPNRKFLYAANEVGNFAGRADGSISAFAIDPKDGSLSAINRRPSGGADPCYLVVDPTGRNVLVANYSGGSLEVLPIGADGALGDPSDVVQHRGSSVDKSRQSSPHAHAIDLDSTGKLAVAPDLGLDRLMVYHFDPDKGELTPNIPPYATVAPGAGPRHFAFHPDGRHAFAINEMASTITVFDFEPRRGTFSELQTISTRPPDARKRGNSTAEILVHPSGRYVYGSNRGDDTIAIFGVEPASGKLTPVGHQATGGKTPRNFAIDPTGQFLLAANQDSGTITVFKIDPQSGKLNPVGDPVAVPSPVCIRFVPIGG